jgi:hypothetical protein
MDAIQVIKLSLLETTANTGIIYEPIMNAEGSVEFIEIGGGGTGPSDIYYTIQTGTYVEECSGVLVRGNNPMPRRKKIEWKSIWAKEAEDTHVIYDTGTMFSNCATGDFNQYATIVYNDPHLDTSYEDGIDNLYEISAEDPEDGPWTTLIGYAHYLYWNNGVDDPDANITFSDSAKILIDLFPNGKEINLDELQRRPEVDKELSENPSCFEGQGFEPPEDVGVEVELPDNFRFESVRETTIDKFNGVSGVYVIGRAIDVLKTTPKDNASSKTLDMESAKVWATINKGYDEVFSLEQGNHYVVSYPKFEAGGSDDSSTPIKPKIVFADNSSRLDPLKITKGEKLKFYIEPDCAYAIDEAGGARETEEAIVLPTGRNSGIIVKQVFVAVELNTPSILVYHPDGWNKKAREIADSLDYQVAPLVVVDKPPPIGYNGVLLNQNSSVQDHDPTTATDFLITELEQAQEDMATGGSGMELTLSFLNEEQVVKLSDALYQYMNSSSGVEVTYICGPSAEPELGAVDNTTGGIVNSIVYSYQDSNSYTISVNCGQKLVGGQMAQVDGGPALKVMESISAKGTIIEDMGNNVYFKVSIDGFGDRIAMNMIPSVLRVGDKVAVSVHNNPVEA